MFSTQQLQDLYNGYLQIHPFLKPPSALYEPADYVMGLGGKRLRPLLLLMSCNIFTDEVETALPAAHAIEIFHNFTLLHDDIMDNAPLRRGKPSVHVKYGTNTGILSGDVMLIYAYDHLMRTKSITAAERLIRLFNAFAIEVCEGQQYDMDFEDTDEVTIEDYLKMIELKTAALIGGAMHLGALIGGAGEENAVLIEQFGRYMGIAFQLQDDILDTFGDPEKFGKKVGGDIVQNKKTFLLLKALELATGDTKKMLTQLMQTDAGQEAQKIAAVTQIYGQLSIRQIATKEVEKYMKAAMDCMERVSVEAGRKELLESLAIEMIGRQV